MNAGYETAGAFHVGDAIVSTTHAAFAVLVLALVAWLHASGQTRSRRSTA